MTALSVMSAARRLPAARAEFDHAGAQRVFAGVVMARCIDAANFLCDWHSAPGVTGDTLHHLAAEHAQQHVVAVIEDGVVTTLMPPEEPAT